MFASQRLFESGKRSDRIKGLLWEGDGFLLLYKRLDNGAFSWPRTESTALEITSEQYRMLMKGLEVVAKRPIEDLENPPRTM
uniref:IS66 family insertion sequence element accessory protein TnpB n=1 Tax=Agathobacter sp. TaxID=2021311 RepID=UPI0040563885